MGGWLARWLGAVASSAVLAQDEKSSKIPFVICRVAGSPAAYPPQGPAMGHSTSPGADTPRLLALPDGLNIPHREADGEVALRAGGHPDGHLFRDEAPCGVGVVGRGVWCHPREKRDELLNRSEAMFSPGWIMMVAKIEGQVVRERSMAGA